MYQHVLQRGKIGTMELKNRVFKPAAQDCPSGLVDEALIRFCGEQAAGGAGLVVTGLFDVNIHESDTSGHPIIWDDSAIAGLCSLSQVIRDNGAKSCCQIAHYGSHGHPRDESYGWRCVSVEGVVNEWWYPILYPEMAGRPMPHTEYSIDEIHELIQAYGDAALRVKKSGFDMVEVHGSNLHGLNLFLASFTNLRKDEYGGSLENRVRVLLEIIDNIQQKCGKSFPISVRLNGSGDAGLPPDELVYLSKKLEEAGVAVISLSSLFGGGSMQTPMAVEVAPGELLKKNLHIPVMICGSMNTLEVCEEAIANGQADFVGTARALYADPEWPQKLFEGRTEDIRPCIRCNECMNTDRYSTKGNLVCTMNPRLGKNLDLPIVPAGVTKKVAVIGGGPAGMEAAMVSAQRGHNVTLFEKRKLGGLVNEASEPSFKQELKRLISYFEVQLKKLNVEVKYEEASGDTLTGFDAVIVATGSKRARLNVPGIQNANVYNGIDVLADKPELGQKLTVIGGGSVGVEVALTEAMKGKEVTIVEMLDNLMTGEHVMITPIYLGMIESLKVNVLTGHSVKSIEGNMVTVTDKAGQEIQIETDNVITAVGLKPDLRLRDALDQIPGLPVYYAGDCESPKLIYDAIHAGFACGRAV